MREASALAVAVSLFHLPSRVRALRSAPLPSDLEVLLRIVAGDDRVLAESLRSVDVTEQTAMAAARFYVEQVLLHPDADCYRALGVTSDATTDQLRRHMALLLRWLHPDRDTGGERAAFVGRITDAWNNLKTAERRADYDAARTFHHSALPRPPACSDAAISARNARYDTSRRHERYGPRAARRRSTRRTIWSLLRVLLGQAR